jgi:hypothetical protein
MPGIVGLNLTIGYFQSFLYVVYISVVLVIFITQDSQHILIKFVDHFGLTNSMPNLIILGRLCAGSEKK